MNYKDYYLFGPIDFLQNSQFASDELKDRNDQSTQLNTNSNNVYTSIDSDWEIGRHNDKEKLYQTTTLDEAQIEDLVKGLLNNNPSLGTNKIEVFVDDSKLSVHGKVPSVAARECIDKIIRSFSEYLTVFNDVEIESAI